jgi:lipopolysaccharide heptosyltransferase III
VSLLAPTAAGGVLLGPGPGEVDAVIPWETASMATLFGGEGEGLAPAARAALSPFDAVVAYTASRALAQALGATGARVVVRSPHPPEDGPHAARWLADAVTALGADPLVVPPLLAFTPAEASLALPWLERLGGGGFLALHPGSGSPRKNWPAERFGAVVDALAQGRPWLLIEGPADGEAVAALARLAGAVHGHDLPARVLGSILSGAGLYLGNDSGVSHLAAASGAPVVVLFGPTDPAVWSPVGPRVTVIESLDRTMEGIAVDMVLARRALT